MAFRGGSVCHFRPVSAPIRPDLMKLHEKLNLHPQFWNYEQKLKGLDI